MESPGEPAAGWPSTSWLTAVLFSLLADPPNPTSCPDGGEELEIPEKGSPEVTGPGEWVGRGH